MYGSTTVKKRIQNAISVLNNAYDKMPSTKGCLEHINKPESEGGCGAWCCLLPGEIVYTSKGPMPIEDIRPGDLVWGKDGFQKVLTTMSRLVDKQCCEIKCRYGRSLRVTLDHPICANLFPRKSKPPKIDLDHFIRADELETGDSKRYYQHYVFVPSMTSIFTEEADHIYINLQDWIDCYIHEGMVFSTNRKRGKSFAPSLKLDEEWLFMLGLYLAEGSLSEHSVDFHISSDESELADSIIAFAKVLNVSYHDKINRGKSRTIRLLSTVLSKLFSAICGRYCDKKFINRNFFGLILPYRKLVYQIEQGYYAGDGKKSDGYSFVTCSQMLAYQMIFINQCYGEYRFLGITKINREDRKTAYQCYVNESVKHHHWYSDKNGIHLPVDSVDLFEYSGPVYDIEVENSHRFTTLIGDVHNCKLMNPSVLYIEFLNSWNHVVSNWPDKKIGDLIEKSLRNYLFDQKIKGCVFFDNESNMCSHHDHRPYSCRAYGIVPDEEFKPRYERLKVIYPDVPYQCNLVETEDGSKVTTKDTDFWWKEVLQAEKAIGIKNEYINDESHGSYRTYHDHILIHLFGEENLEKLSLARINLNKEEKEKVIQQMMSAYNNIKEKMNNGSIKSEDT